MRSLKNAVNRASGAVINPPHRWRRNQPSMGGRRGGGYGMRIFNMFHGLGTNVMVDP